MHEFYNKSLIAFLGLLAASLVLAYACVQRSYLHATLQTDTDNSLAWHIHQDTDASTGGKSSIDVLETRPQLRLSLILGSAGENPHAAVDLFFDGDNGKPVLKDLSQYSTASFYIKCQPANTLVLIIPTFDPAISRRDDILSYRTLAAFFPCNTNRTRVEIDLTRLETPQWWFDMFKMDLSRHRYKLDQVPKFAIGTTFQSPKNIRSQVELSELELNGRDFRYLFGLGFSLFVAWGTFGIAFFRAHSRALVADLNARLNKDLPLIAYQQLSLEPHRDKEKAAILRHIATNYTDPEFDIETVATNTGASRSKINDVLKAELGYTFSGYLNKLRLTEAARLLVEKGSATIAEIAYSVGYSNISYFNKLFKEEYGSTPKAFRTVSRQ